MRTKRRALALVHRVRDRGCCGPRGRGAHGGAPDQGALEPRRPRVRRRRARARDPAAGRRASRLKPHRRTAQCHARPRARGRAACSTASSRTAVGRVPLTATIRAPRPAAGGGRSRSPGAFARRAPPAVVTNHPIGGPVFAGPQIEPWTCQEGARDAKCNQPPTFRYLYLRKGAPKEGASCPAPTRTAARIVPVVDPENPPPPGEIESTTTTEGVTVPFIVRLERLPRPRPVCGGNPLRPEQALDADEPQRQFNRRLVITHGFSCNTEYKVGAAPSVLESEGARRWVHRHVPRARPRGAQLQPAHAGRVARDDEGVHDRPLRDGALDDRQRLLRRLPRPAPGRQQLSGRVPGDHAAVLVPRRLVVGDAVRGVLLRPRVRRRARRGGTPASCTTRSRRARSSTTPTRRTRCRSPPSSRTRGSRRGRAPVCQTTGSTTRTPTRAACAARCRTTWSTRSVATRAASPGGASTTSGSSTG